MPKTNVINPTPTNGYFRFSKQAPNIESLGQWFEWFKGRDIPCCITKEQRGNYFLWRAGEEAISPEAGDARNKKVEAISPDVKIVKAYRWGETD